MSGGQFLFAVATAGLGFAAADFVDRWLATYDPAAYASPTTQLALPTDRFTGGNGTLANSLNVAAPPSMLRIGAGVGMIALPALGAMVVKNPMARSGLQGATLGAGIKLFSKLWDTYVIGNLLKPAAGANPLTATVLGLRLYPAELTAQANMASSPQTLQTNALSPGLGRQAAGRLAGDVGPVAQGAPAQLARAPMGMRSSARGLGDDPTAVEDGENCGCLGDRLPMFLGVLGNAA
jgi:hypothetical protein